MAKPEWITAQGSLGVIQEEEFYQLLLEAEDPDGDQLNYTIIAGYLPPGLALSTFGTIEGRPKRDYFFQGVPTSVTEDVTSRFVCRIQSTTGQISDRTFEITVTGQDAPVIENTASDLGIILDGVLWEYQLNATDLDNETLTWSLAGGELPPGVTLDSVTGLISGYPLPTPNLALDDTVGWSAEAGWEEFPWDHGTAWVNQGYEFTVEVTDGKEVDRQDFQIQVLAKSLLTADIDTFSADSTFIRADQDTKHQPVLLTDPTSLGTFAHDNYFAFKFQAQDFDGDELEYGIASTDGFGFDDINGNGYDIDLFDQGGFSIPDGLTFSQATGWLFGYIGRQSAAQVEYNFAVYAYKKSDPNNRSEFKYFTLTVIGDISQILSWDTPENLGSIATGEISELFVQASNPFDLNLNYSIISGRLPQALRLLENGLIVGRASFEVTSFDGGATTFDENVRELGVNIDDMLFDRIYTFTVEATSAGGELTATRTFTLEITQSDNQPYESLYLRAQPGQTDKDLYLSLINNTDVLPGEVIYRNGDPFFGVQRDMRMLLMAGLKASSSTEYVQAMQKNHFRKNIPVGDLQISRAFDENREVIYEVLYFTLNDRQANDTGSVAAILDLNGKIERRITSDSGDITIDTTLIDANAFGENIVYPNSFANMRSQLRTEIGSNVIEPLPKWMRQRQADGSIIGWQPVIPIAYLQPGTGEEVLFRLRRLNGFIDQKLIDFTVDRYIWDNSMSGVWDPVTDSYIDSDLTTFDAERQTVVEPVVDVDFAVSVPFNHLDGRTTEYIQQTLGGLDGIVLSLQDVRIVFAQQELYTGFIEEEDGWIRHNDIWDDNDGWDADPWDDYEIIPGYVESLNDSSISNERASVWRFDFDETDEVWRLVLDQVLFLGDSVFVRNGGVYGGYIIQYGPLIQFFEGLTVPRFDKVQPKEQVVPTIFDSGDTRIIDNVTIYQLLDTDDKYLVFPKENIWS